MIPEKCCGCNAEAERHPFSVITATDYTVMEPHSMIYVVSPVCRECHTNPAHRLKPIDGSFFRREDEANALKMAGGCSSYDPFV